MKKQDEMSGCWLMACMYDNILKNKSMDSTQQGKPGSSQRKKLASHLRARAIQVRVELQILTKGILIVSDYILKVKLFTDELETVGCEIFNTN